MPRSPQELTRCDWSLNVSQDYLDYHDNEWGVPVRDDQTQFEFLTLESAQAGLSWAVILHKRKGYRKAFADFQPQRVARFSEKKIARLCEEPSIVRNRLKITAAVNNAQQFLKVQEEFDGFCNYIWRFVDGQPIQNRWKRQDECPVTTPQSDALSKDLKRRGFKFVGSTTIYAHMQATGMVNDHLTNCYRHKPCREMA